MNNEIGDVEREKVSVSFNKGLVYRLWLNFEYESIFCFFG